MQLVKKKSTVKSGKEYREELDDLVIDNISYEKEEDSINLVISFNKVIHPYIRHRISGSRTYDPLSMYKGRFVKVLKEYINKHPDSKDILDIINYNNGKVNIKENLDIFIQPPKGLSLSRLMDIANPKVSVPVNKKPDTDNYIKTMNDILNDTGSLWEDDGRIYSISSNKYYSLEPCTILTLVFTPDTTINKDTRSTKNLSKYDQILLSRARDYKNN